MTSCYKLLLPQLSRLGRLPLEQWPAFDGVFDHTQQQDKKLRQGILMMAPPPTIVELMFRQTKPSLIIKNTAHGERYEEEGSVRAMSGREMEERPLGKEFPGSFSEKSEIIEHMSHMGECARQYTSGTEAFWGHVGSRLGTR